VRSARCSLAAVIASFALLCASPVAALSLKQAYDEATAAGGYDRYIELTPGVTYTGGLWLGATFNKITAEFEGPCEDVRIVGNGAILDLRGQQITMAYCHNRLDIDDCVIVGGDVKFRGYGGDELNLIPEGSVRHVTFYEPHDYGVRMFGCGTGILVERNIVVDAIDTGVDFQYLTGEFSASLPTGTGFARSLTFADVGLFENWSYHSDPVANADAIRHFSILCDYG